MNKLVDYYINRVKCNPELHDKVEFEVMFTCTFPGISQMMASLEKEDTYPAPSLRANWSVSLRT